MRVARVAGDSSAAVLVWPRKAITARGRYGTRAINAVSRVRVAPGPLISSQVTVRPCGGAGGLVEAQRSGVDQLQAARLALEVAVGARLKSPCVKATHQARGLCLAAEA